MRKFFPFLPLLLLAGVLLIPGLLRQNLWSLAYVKARQSPAGVPADFPTPPENHPHSDVWLAQAALERGNTAEAIHILQPLAAQGDMSSLNQLGNALMAAGEREAAINAWEQAGNLNALIQAAQQAEASNDLETARLAYRATYRGDPENYALDYAYFLWWKSGQTDAAIAILETTLDTFPHSLYRHSWWRYLGDIQRDQEAWDQAEAAYHASIAESPADYYAHLGLGWVLYKRDGDRAGAEAEFQQVIEIAPETGEGQFARGQVAAAEGQPASADQWFAEAIAANPTNPWWWWTRADNALQSGDLEQARSLFLDSIAQFPDFSQHYYTLSEVYRQLDQPNQAVEAIEKAIALLEPPNLWYYVQAGLLYEWTGDSAHALQAYQQALTIDPNNPAAVQGVARLTGQ